MERNARLPQSAHQHQRQHAGKPYKIDFAFDGERRRIRRRVEERRARFFTVMEIIYIDQIKQREQQDDGNSIGLNRCAVVQKKPTPFRKPRNKGGSPSGVNAPPILATSKIKKITTCTVCRRLSFARSNGRISSIAAPVVPITPASSVPRAISPVSMTGEPCRLPRTHKPPATIYSAISRIMKGRYSASSACTMLCAALPAPWTAANGATNSAAQNSAIFPK